MKYQEMSGSVLSFWWNWTWNVGILKCCCFECFHHARIRKISLWIIKVWIFLCTKAHQCGEIGGKQSKLSQSLTLLGGSQKLCCKINVGNNEVHIRQIGVSLDRPVGRRGCYSHLSGASTVPGWSGKISCLAPGAFSWEHAKVNFIQPKHCNSQLF